jgi:hypothetical protein
LKANDPALSQAEVRARLDYNPATGIFTWRHDGKTAGTPTAEGYLDIYLAGRSIKAHRLAFLWMYGHWPQNLVDHVNGIRHDNRLINIRPATNAQNQWNRAPSYGTKSGFKGVKYHAKSGKWRAELQVNNRIVRVRGLFDSAELAHRAYQVAARDYFGEFARFEADRPSKPAKREQDAPRT